MLRGCMREFNQKKTMLVSKTEAAKTGAQKNAQNGRKKRAPGRIAGAKGRGDAEPPT